MLGMIIVYEDVYKTPQYTTSTQSTPGANYTFLANITFSTPDNFGPDILGGYLLSNWRLNVTHELRSGATFTLESSKPSGIKI